MDDDTKTTTTEPTPAIDVQEQATAENLSADAPSTSPAGNSHEQASSEPAEPSPEETIAAMDHVETPSEIILTVRMKRMLFFAIKDAEVKIMQGEQSVDTARTDKHGQAIFKLKPGAYTVVSGDKNAGIELTKNATVKL